MTNNHRGNYVEMHQHYMPNNCLVCKNDWAKLGAGSRALSHKGSCYKLVRGGDPTSRVLVLAGSSHHEVGKSRTIKHLSNRDWFSFFFIQNIIKRDSKEPISNVFFRCVIIQIMNLLNVYATGAREHSRLGSQQYFHSRLSFNCVLHFTFQLSSLRV